MRSVDFHTKVAGVTFSNADGIDRQDLIEELAEGVQRVGTVSLALKREPGNPYDTCAVAVFDPHGRQIGYLSSKVAETIAPLMDGGMRIQAEVTSITGGGLTQSFGVNIRVWSA